jgi:hypothetical protein
MATKHVSRCWRRHRSSRCSPRYHVHRRGTGHRHGAAVTVPPVISSGPSGPLRGWCVPIRCVSVGAEGTRPVSAGPVEELIMTMPKAVVDNATRDALLGLAIGDVGVLKEAVGIREAEQQSSGLDSATFGLVKTAALIALDSPPASYLWQIANALDAGGDPRRRPRRAAGRGAPGRRTQDHRGGPRNHGGAGPVPACRTGKRHMTRPGPW